MEGPVETGESTGDCRKNSSDCDCVDISFGNVEEGSCERCGENGGEGGGGRVNDDGGSHGSAEAAEAEVVKAKEATGAEAAEKAKAAGAAEAEVEGEVVKEFVKAAAEVAG